MLCDMILELMGDIENSYVRFEGMGCLIRVG
jgi:hypothetical protein